MGVASRAERGEGALPGLAVARVGHERHVHELPVVLLRDERHRRARHDVRDRRQLVGRRLGGGDESRDRLGGRRQDQHAAHGGFERMQLESEARRDAEVAASAADRPEQVRVMLGVDAQELAVGGHDVGREQGVDRQSVLADEIADTAAERDPAEPDRTRVPEAGREVMGRRRGRVLTGGQSGLGPGGPPVHVDLERLHVAQIEHDAVVDHGVSRAAVAAAADREREPGLAGEVDDMGDIVGVGWPDDDHWPAIDATRDDGPGLVVLGVVRRDHPAADGGTQARDGEGVGGRGRHDDLLLGREA